MTSVEVRTAAPHERGDVAAALATAFADDPVVRWLCPDGRGIATLFRMLATHQHAAPGCADLALRDGEVVGAALWDPPGHRRGLRAEVASWPASVAALRLRVPHGLALERAFARARPDGPVWYLAQVGATVPGEGAGSALLAHRLATVTGPAYLESSNPANISLYERFGFTVSGEIRLPWGGPTCWPMHRPAA